MSEQDCIIICLDVGPSMSVAPPTGGDTYLEMAVRVANQIVQQKVRTFSIVTLHKHLSASDPFTLLRLCS